MKRSPPQPVKQPAGRVQTGGATFPIVGIGASAGGLEAFSELLTALPLDTGMAFVLIQHLEAEHESMLTELLSKVTEMPVTEVRHGTRVEPNHVYVIRANTDLSLAGGVLRTSGRKAAAGRHLPIDHFFSTLAEAQGQLAIGVILSGTASDGTLGLKAIKAAGGITFAQDPKSAKFDGMPKSALLAGCVDFVLSPERIATELSQITLHSHAGLPNLEKEYPLVPAWDEDWIRIFKLLRAASGVDFTFYKKPTISRRIARRMALKKVERLSEYLKILQADREELDALYRDLLIQVTSFFGYPTFFARCETGFFRKSSREKRLGRRFASGYRAAPAARRPIRSQFACWRVWGTGRLPPRFKSLPAISTSRPSIKRAPVCTPKRH